MGLCSGVKGSENVLVLVVPSNQVRSIGLVSRLTCEPAPPNQEIYKTDSARPTLPTHIGGIATDFICSAVVTEE